MTKFHSSRRIARHLFNNSDTLTMAQAQKQVSDVLAAIQEVITQDGGVQLRNIGTLQVVNPKQKRMVIPARMREFHKKPLDADGCITIMPRPRLRFTTSISMRNRLQRELRKK